MASIQRFEDFDAWKRARTLTRQVYAVTAAGSFARDFELRGQIRRAAVSVMSNIAEGFERDGTKEFLQFLSTAKGSAGEVRSQLYVALDASHIDQVTFDELCALTCEVSRLIHGLMRYLQSTDIRGQKYLPSNRPTPSSES
jgi:four helix bundle protein